MDAEQNEPGGAMDGTRAQGMDARERGPRFRGKPGGRRRARPMDGLSVRSARPAAWMPQKNWGGMDADRAHLRRSAQRDGGGSVGVGDSPDERTVAARPFSAEVKGRMARRCMALHVRTHKALRFTLARQA